MSNVAFRDSSIVVIETSTTLIRAGLGIHDLIRTPTIEIQARVGIRSDLTGKGLAEPQPSASTSRAPSALPVAFAKVTDYLVGKQLDDALAAGQDLVISWPFKDGIVSDWIQAEALWKYTLFTGLGLRRVQNESPVLLSLFPGLPRSSLELTCQIFFERFNVAAFSILDRPVAQLYAANSITGLVVDINDHETVITPVSDGLPVHAARTHVVVGVRDCERFLAQLFKSNTSVIKELKEVVPGVEKGGAEADEVLMELARQVWKTGLVKVPSGAGEAQAIEDEGITDIAAVIVAGKEKAVIESGMKKRANAKASAAEQARAKEIEAMDLITIEFKGKEVTLGKERHRFCEPLFDIALLNSVPGLLEEKKPRVEKGALLTPLQDAAGYAVGLTEVDQRQYIWQGLVVTGEVTGHVKGIGPALHSRLSPFILGNPDAHMQNDVQPRNIRLVKVPEYFANFREMGDGLAAFLGSTIVAKIIFHDPNGKSFVSKSDYSERGPKTVLEMSPSLL